MLFALEDGADVEDVIRLYWREVPGDVEGREFADAIVRAVAAERGEVDKCIRTASKNWRLERMARVDRNVIRLGVLELTRDDTPRAVILDEAVELAKRYGAEGSSVFVNGVLDRIADDLSR